MEHETSGTIRTDLSDLSSHPRVLPPPSQALWSYIHRLSLQLSGLVFVMILPVWGAQDIISGRSWAPCVILIGYRPLMPTLLHPNDVLDHQAQACTSSRCAYFQAGQSSFRRGVCQCRTSGKIACLLVYTLAGCGRAGRWDGELVETILAYLGSARSAWYCI